MDRNRKDPDRFHPFRQKDPPFHCLRDRIFFEGSGSIIIAPMTEANSRSSIFLLLFCSTILLSACGSPSLDRGELKKEAHRLLDDWHQAAAKADKEAYFRAMDSSSVFIGTDPTERWDRKAFEEWTAPHFEGDTAWAFTPSERKIRIGDRGTFAWFDEKLETWMGICRGSGVLIRREGNWRIVQYHLAKKIPNPKMDAVLKILKDE